MKVLFVGDVVGSSGRDVLKKHISKVRGFYDLIIVNGENAASGFGMSDRIYKDFISWGVDYITSGNHTWDRPDTAKDILCWDRFIRPLNFGRGAAGNGYVSFEVCGLKVTLVNLLGRVFMGLADDPFAAFDNIYEGIKDSFIIVDFHAEATAEKSAFAHYVSGRANVVLGTHTHVQTNDLRLVNDNLLYITDVGMCGSADSCIGMTAEGAVHRFISCLPIKMSVEKKGRMMLNALEFETDGKVIKDYKIINIEVE